MKKKTVITVLLTVIVFLSAATLGVNNTFRVDGVVLNASTVSEAAKGEAESLQRDLAQAYLGKSTIFAGVEEAEEVLARYPYFRLTALKREFPNLLIIEATEDIETFAVEAGGDGYYILSENGTMLGKRETSENRADGGANIELLGFTLSGSLGEKAQGDDIQDLFAVATEMSKLLGGVRANIKSVTLARYGSVTQFTLKMREGVTVYLIKPNSFTLEKAKLLTEKYLSLSDQERLTGTIVATNNDEGAVSVEYYASVFEE